MPKIKIPKPRRKPMSSLDGYEMVALDNADLVANLPEMLKIWPQRGLTVVSVADVKFHNVQPGKIVVLFDLKKDPRWQKA